MAGLIAAGIERRGIAAGTLAGVVALPHTEGCGSGGSDDLYTRTLVGHVLHPAVAAALLLEHGCERTHNDYFRAALRDAGQSADRFGWASIQLDGGIAAVDRAGGRHFAAAVAGRVPARTGGRRRSASSPPGTRRRVGRRPVGELRGRRGRFRRIGHRACRRPHAGRAGRRRHRPEPAAPTVASRSGRRPVGST